MFFCAEQSFSRIGFFHTVDHYVIGNDAQWIFMLKIFASGLIAFAFNKIQRVVKINFILDIVILLLIQYNFFYFMLLIVGFLLY